MAKEQNILNLYKRAGETPLECLNRFKVANSKYKDLPMTYLGRLDPMAEGVLLVLAGDTRTNRDEYLSLNKEYVFECLWGVETDTLDALGIIVNTKFNILSEDKIKKEIKKFVGKRNQTYPIYSSKKVLGQPLFKWAREGKGNDILLPKRDVEIFSIEILSSEIKTGKKLLENIENKISKIKGDFRQREILNKWKEVLKNDIETNFLITRMKAHVSSGTYIRALANEIGKSLETFGIALSIIRNKVGDFDINDSLGK